MRLVGLLNPMVPIPARDDFSKSRLTAETTLQSPKVAHAEGWWQLVIDGMVRPVSLALATCVGELTFQSLAKGGYLLLERIVGHH